MAAWKGAAIVAGVVASLAGILFGTGVISLRKRDGGSDDSAEAGEDEKGEKKRRKGKKRKGGQNPDLDSLAYLNSVPMTEADKGKVGVVHVEKERVFDGYTLINPCFRAGKRKTKEQPVHEAQLWDIEGKMVHKWAAEPFTKKSGWAIARIDPEGYLYVVNADTGVAKLDWESNIVWKVEDVFHHDLNFDENGDVAVVTEQKREVPRPGDMEGDPVEILDHGITFISKDGKVGKQIWLYDVFKDEPVFEENLETRIEAKEKTRKGEGRVSGLDIFHTNAVRVLHEDIEGLGKKGDILTSARHLDTIATVSRDTGKLIWSWGADELQHQHDPSITPDGNVAVFDNGTARKKSRVLIVDPKSNEIVRTYDGGASNGFFSAGRGLAQVLPNNNLLVFVSNQARIFEVAADDHIVWDFYGPYIRGNARLPLRGTRLEGPTLELVRNIVTGKTPAPKVAVGAETPTDTKAEDGKTEDATKTGDAKTGDAKTDTKSGADAKADTKAKPAKEEPAEEEDEPEDGEY